MILHAFQDLQLSALGFGAMRLPVLANGEIDAAELDRMVDAAIASGINYFDTAYPYHGGKSETAIGTNFRAIRMCPALRRLTRKKSSKPS